jgi:hypothetical protein
MDTYIHTYIHTYVHTYIHTYLGTLSALEIQFLGDVLEADLGVRHIDAAQTRLDHTVAQTRHQRHVAICCEERRMLITVLVERTD